MVEIECEIASKSDMVAEKLYIFQDEYLANFLSFEKFYHKKVKNPYKNEFSKNVIFTRISENGNFHGNVSFNFLVAHPPPGSYPRDCTRDGLWVPPTGLHSTPAGLHAKMSRGEGGREKN